MRKCRNKGRWTLILILCFGVMTMCMSSGVLAGGDVTEDGVGTTLIRFDFHKSVNQEVGIPAGIPGFFTYYFQGKEYHYGFRFDKNGAGEETQVFGTAYVWAPYSIIHYDAAGGMIKEDAQVSGMAADSTAFLGNIPLSATRGDGISLGNSGNPQQRSRRYATDYTVYGNSLALSEGALPTAYRDGYRFLGWYVHTSAGKVITDKLDQLAGKDWFGKIPDELNTRFTQRTKVLENLEDEKTPALEITVYAKWEKIYDYEKCEEH